MDGLPLVPGLGRTPTRWAISSRMRKNLLIALTVAIAAFVFVPASASAANGDASQRVIAELALPYNAAPSQIAATTDQLLASLPTGDYSVNNRYSTLPYVALSAGPSALSVLQQSDLVAAVHSDRVVSAAKRKAGKKAKKSKKSCKKSKRGKAKKNRKTKNSSKGSKSAKASKRKKSKRKPCGKRKTAKKKSGKKKKSGAKKARR